MLHCFLWTLANRQSIMVKKTINKFEVEGVNWQANVSLFLDITKLPTFVGGNNSDTFDDTNGPWKETCLRVIKTKHSVCKMMNCTPNIFWKKRNNYIEQTKKHQRILLRLRMKVFGRKKDKMTHSVSKSSFGTQSKLSFGKLRVEIYRMANERFLMRKSDRSD